MKFAIFRFFQIFLALTVKQLVFQFKWLNLYSNSQLLIQTYQLEAAVSLPLAGPSGRR
jgi:hypothetical protein